jgi:hypothetical protein
MKLELFAVAAGIQRNNNIKLKLKKKKIRVLKIAAVGG